MSTTVSQQPSSGGGTGRRTGPPRSGGPRQERTGGGGGENRSERRGPGGLNQKSRNSANGPNIDDYHYQARGDNNHHNQRSNNNQKNLSYNKGSNSNNNVSANNARNQQQNQGGDHHSSQQHHHHNSDQSASGTTHSKGHDNDNSTSNQEMKDKIQPTPEQLRIASLMIDNNSTSDDSDIKKMVDEIVDITGASPDAAAVALHDCDNDVAKAVHAIFEGETNEDDWQKNLSKKQKKKEAEKLKEQQEKERERQQLQNGEANKSRGGRGRGQRGGPGDRGQRGGGRDRPLRERNADNAQGEGRPYSKRGEGRAPPNDANAEPMDDKEFGVGEWNESAPADNQGSDDKGGYRGGDNRRDQYSRGGPAGAGGRAPRDSGGYGGGGGPRGKTRTFSNTQHYRSERGGSGMDGDHVSSADNGFPNSIDTWTNETTTGGKPAAPTADLSSMPIGQWNDESIEGDDDEEWKTIGTKEFTPSSKAQPSMSDHHFTISSSSVGGGRTTVSSQQQQQQTNMSGLISSGGPQMGLKGPHQQQSSTAATGPHSTSSQQQQFSQILAQSQPQQQQHQKQDGRSGPVTTGGSQFGNQQLGQNNAINNLLSNQASRNPTEAIMNVLSGANKQGGGIGGFQSDRMAPGGPAYSSAYPSLSNTPGFNKETAANSLKSSLGISSNTSSSYSAAANNLPSSIGQDSIGAAPGMQRPGPLSSGLGGPSRPSDQSLTSGPPPGVPPQLGSQQSSVFSQNTSSGGMLQQKQVGSMGPRGVNTLGQQPGRTGKIMGDSAVEMPANDTMSSLNVKFGAFDLSNNGSASQSTADQLYARSLQADGKQQLIGNASAASDVSKLTSSAGLSQTYRSSQESSVLDPNSGLSAIGSLQDRTKIGPSIGGGSAYGSKPSDTSSASSAQSALKNASSFGGPPGSTSASSVQEHSLYGKQTSVSSGGYGQNVSSSDPSQSSQSTYGGLSAYQSQQQQQQAQQKYNAYGTKDQLETATTATSSGPSGSSAASHLGGMSKASHVGGYDLMSGSTNTTNVMKNNPLAAGKGLGGVSGPPGMNPAAMQMGHSYYMGAPANYPSMPFMPFANDAYFGFAGADKFTRGSDSDASGPGSAGMGHAPPGPNHYMSFPPGYHQYYMPGMVQPGMYMPQPGYNPMAATGIPQASPNAANSSGTYGKSGAANAAANASTYGSHYNSTYDSLSGSNAGGIGSSGGIGSGGSATSGAGSASAGGGGSGGQDSGYGKGTGYGSSMMSSQSKNLSGNSDLTGGAGNLYGGGKSNQMGKGGFKSGYGTGGMGGFASNQYMGYNTQNPMASMGLQDSGVGSGSAVGGGRPNIGGPGSVGQAGGLGSKVGGMGGGAGQDNRKAYYPNQSGSWN